MLFWLACFTFVKENAGYKGIIIESKIGIRIIASLIIEMRL